MLQMHATRQEQRLEGAPMPRAGLGQAAQQHAKHKAATQRAGRVQGAVAAASRAPVFEALHPP